MKDDILDSTLEITQTKSTRDPLFRIAAGAGDGLLLVLAGARVGHRLVLGKESVTLGRGSASSLQLDGEAVSRTHARVEWRAGVHYLVDCDSTNGSFVNYTRVREAALRDGDQLQIGHVLLKYMSGSNIETAYHEEFRRLVRRDALTGALNRNTFDDEARVAVTAALRDSKPLNLILFDLDHFKRINDEHGHTAGDLVLSESTQAVLAKLVEPNLLGRVGGEEFAVLHHGTLAEAGQLAEELRRALAAAPVRFEGHHIRVTGSFGVAPFVGGAFADMHAAADTLLYEAKDGGRNRVVVASGT
ncbi:MAG TPA: GGDEF domain-containing protein [Polyangiaceae bacterium]|nr:GGDEF domain-containing protein [Polyangiaceae bacterium]